MEGPTPVSALMHAATMVTAGVYMIARCTPLFMASPHAQEAVAVVGGFTALLAALIAITQTDLKRVLAYSTISQLGYMFLGLGVGTLAGISAGMFHLFTHAFFKALLFLAAGSVMHAMGGVIDMRRIGGLRHSDAQDLLDVLVRRAGAFGRVPVRRVLEQRRDHRARRAMRGEAAARLLYTVLFWASLFTAFLTALYTFRGLFLTFYGRERIAPEAGHHAARIAVGDDLAAWRSWRSAPGGRRRCSIGTISSRISWATRRRWPIRPSQATASRTASMGIWGWRCSARLSRFRAWDWPRISTWEIAGRSND